MLTISRLSRWSINYYNDTANKAQAAAMDRQAAGGRLGEYYSESDTRVPTWALCRCEHEIVPILGDHQRGELVGEECRERDRTASHLSDGAVDVRATPQHVEVGHTRSAKGVTVAAAGIRAGRQVPRRREQEA